MAVTHSTAARNGIASYVIGLLNASPPGKLIFQTSGVVAVATLPFANPAFGAAAGGVATANAITDDTNAAGGTIAQAQLSDGTGAAVVMCSVTATGGGGDITMNSLVVSPGQTVHISSLTYTAPP